MVREQCHLPRVPRAGVHLCAEIHGGQQRASSPLELELQAGSCEPPDSGSWEPNLTTSRTQVLLTNEPSLSLQPPMEFGKRVQRALVPAEIGVSPW